MIEAIIRESGEIDTRLETLGTRLNFAWDFKTAPCHVTVKPYQNRITRAQQNLYWRWLGILAEGLSGPLAKYGKDDFHDLMRHKFLGTEELLIGGEVITRLPSTTKLDRLAMARYMDQIEAWATDMGILLPIPADNEYAKFREAQNAGGSDV